MSAPCTGLGADDALLHLGSSGDLQRQIRKQQGGDKLLKMSASTVFLKHHYRDRKEKKKRQRINGGRMQCRNANWMESFNKSYTAHLTQIGFARHSLPLPTVGK